MTWPLPRALRFKPPLYAPLPYEERGAKTRSLQGLPLSSIVPLSTVFSRPPGGPISESAGPIRPTKELPLAGKPCGNGRKRHKSLCDNVLRQLHDTRQAVPILASLKMGRHWLPTPIPGLWPLFCSWENRPVLRHENGTITLGGPRGPSKHGNLSKLRNGATALLLAGHPGRNRRCSHRR